MINTNALRNKILTLAMQGQLSERNAKDIPIDVLIENIKSEKTEILKTRQGREDKRIKECSKDEVPYSIPQKWRWIKLGDIGIFKKGPFGSALTKAMFVPENVNTIKVYEQQHAINKNHKLGTYYITKEYFEEKMKGFEVLPGDIIVSCAGTIGETYILPNNIKQGIINQALMRITLVNSVHDKFFLYYFEFELKKAAQEKSNGSTIKNIPPFDVLKNWYFPLAPIEEQQRIVEKIDELFKLLDIIDELQVNYNSDLEVLKSKLIDACIQGKLTEQLPKDGTAEDLYAEIQTEKTKLVKEGKIKKEKPLPEITEDEISFDIPSNWKWVRLGEISAKISSGNTPAGGNKSDAYVEKGYSFFREQNIYDDGIHEEGLVYITEELLKTRVNSTVLPMDILLNITGGSIGRCALIPDDFTKGSINQHILIIRMIDPRLRFYIHTCICSPYIQKYIKGNTVGDKEGFSAGRCKNMLIPLPPLEEQIRIVEKINELLANM